ncbi:MAG TPA: hypothetical protein H9824_05635 [Candidatus Bacteroides pullicola]|uniref:Uncharacterized protein n=1 Tax=Candidatus Bacteroides pullicola TaxID=2838475 RepID=A0A9D1ZHT8_9BACE|nr:hypothetical protein [Candidatus Bacteroides pullicola]
MNEETKKLTIPEGYEFDKVENGEVILKKKEIAMPKTWEECMDVLGSVSLFGLRKPYLRQLPPDMEAPMTALCELLLRRNAWWKQLGWKPDWKDKCDKFCITTGEGRVKATVYCASNAILAFPTAEVRDQFYEAFRDLIEEAKELL